MIEYADVIVCVQHGDSGKGKITNHLAKLGTYTHCLRTSGSGNAGHTVYNNKKKIVTHCVPTGVLHGLRSIVGHGCVLNPTEFLKELEDLKNQGVDVDDKVFIAKNTHIVTDKHLAEDGRDETIGTTKKGNGPAYRDKYARTGIQAKDCSELQPYLIDLYDEFYDYKKVRLLCEGAQGFGIDIDWGEYPYVTSGHCTLGSVLLNGVPRRSIRNVYGIAKVYETYVGKKQFEPTSSSVITNIFKQIREIGEEYGATTGRPRQINFLNLESLEKAVKINDITHLIFNKTDVLEKVNCFKLYDRKGFPVSFSTMEEMKWFIQKEVYGIGLDMGSDIKVLFSGDKETL